MGSRIIPKAGLENVAARLFKWSFLIKVNPHGNGGTLQTDELPGEFQEMLTEVQGQFGKPTQSHLRNRRQANFQIKTDPNGKILFRSPYHNSQWGDAELQRKIDKAILEVGFSPLEAI